jgi:type IV secretion system protein VirD4
VQTLRWSPVLCSADWDGALLMARAMVTGSQVGAGTTDANHWTRRAQALLAPMLHAAAVSGRQMRDVVGWVIRHEIDEPGALLTEHGGADLAIGQLIGLQNTEARERSSIFSAAADALDAYTSHAALEAASSPNFFAGRFVTSKDTIYITAPAEHQQLTAPLVCGLISEIRRETYTHHRDGTLKAPVLFALDEVANVAPITELPQIASEGASQGILLLAALQDLSQARARWGPAADGFLTLFGTKLILPGIADHKTLETISTALGEYDRRVVSHTSPNVGLLSMLPGSRSPIPHNSTTTSTQRTRRLSPGDIAGIPAGNALHLDGVQWELVALTPAHTVEPWRTLTTPAPTIAGR